MGQKNTTVVATLGIEMVMPTDQFVAGVGVVDKGTAQMLRDVQKIDAAMSNVGGLDRATQEIVQLAGEAARTATAAAREFNRIENAGERMAAQLERQLSVFGKTSSEVRSLKAETVALAASGKNMTELADRVRGLEAALSAEEQAVRDAAHAHQMFEAAVRSGAAAMREAEAAANATAIREAAHAYDMFNAKVREGVTVMKAAARADAEMFGNLGQAIGGAAREQQAATAAADQYASKLEAQVAAIGKTTTELRQMETAQRALAAAQAGMPDEAARIRAASAALDANDQALREAAQAHQMFEARVRQGAMAMRDAEQAAKAHSAGMTGVGRTAGLARHDLINLSAQIQDIVVSLQGGQKPLSVFVQQGSQIGQIAASSGVGLRGMALAVAGLLLPFAPVIAAIALATAGLGLFVRWVNQGVTNNQLTRDLGSITGGADATKAQLYKLKDETVTWGDTTKAVFEVVGKDVMAAFVGDTKGMAKQVKDILDDLASYGRTTLAALYAGLVGTRSYLGELEKGGALGIGKMLIGQGDPKLIEKTYGAAYAAADTYLTKLGGRVKTAAIENARERIAKSVGYNAEPAPKVDRHAEQLAREAAATEAQIRNLYSLADAYGVSGAAALIAEARVKAESAAIKKRADIEEAVARQVRLAIAQRVSDAAKSTAVMREQATIQEQVNAAVADGTVPAERAAELMRDRLADLPLLAALEAAGRVNDAKGAGAATAALYEQRTARDRLTEAEIRGRLEADLANGRNELATLQEEIRLIGASNDVRTHALAIMKATQDAEKIGYSGKRAADYIKQRAEIADAQSALAAGQERFNNLLPESEEAVKQYAATFGTAFGSIGDSIAAVTAALIDHSAEQRRIDRLTDQRRSRAAGDATQLAKIEREASRATAQNQIGAYADVTSAAKSMFSERSRIYKALQTAETVLRAVQLAMSVQKMIQDAAETASTIANSGVRAAAHGTEGIAAQSKLPFPANLAAMAATAAALTAIGVAVVGSLGGGKNNLPAANTGTGTVLGNADAQSESITRAIEVLSDIDTVTMRHSAGMLASLRAIESKIGGLAALLVRTGDIDASGGVDTGFKTDMAGNGLSYLATGGALGVVLKQIPVIGDLLSGLGGVVKSLFGTKTSVIASGLFGGPQAIADVLNAGFDASYFSDVKKTKKFFGISAGSKFSTQYGDADSEIEQQFGLILRGFYETIGAAAGPLGMAAGDVEDRLKGFVVDLGKIDLQGLTGDEISEKLTAVFGAAADDMARAAVPGLERFQAVGEGYFETLTRVAVTMETVSTSLGRLSANAQGLDIAASMGIAGLFGSLSDLTSASDAYFEAYFSDAERAAIRTEQVSKAFANLGVGMPDTLAAFRSLVEAQDLTTGAGQQVYATLLQLAPAFADLKGSMDGAASAAAIVRQRQDLEKQMLDLVGDTAASRAAELAKLDPSNRALQQQIWAIEDAKAAADAASELRDAWKSVGDTIMDEVRRIRGLTDANGGVGFASLMGQFNAANAAARAGDMDAAKNLPQLSKSLLDAAALAATSRQELDRVQAETAAMLEATYGAINGGGASPVEDRPITAVLSNMAATANISDARPADDLVAEIKALREEVAALRAENNAGHAATAGNTGRLDRRIEAVTSNNGGEAITVTGIAA